MCDGASKTLPNVYTIEIFDLAAVNLLGSLLRISETANPLVRELTLSRDPQFLHLNRRLFISIGLRIQVFAFRPYRIICPNVC